jgi:hypothetical protein
MVQFHIVTTFSLPCAYQAVVSSVQSHNESSVVCISLFFPILYIPYDRRAVLNVWSADTWGSVTPTQGVRECCLGNKPLLGHAHNSEHDVAF